jgi:hypothetical protein
MSAIAIRHMLFAKWIVKTVLKTLLFQRRCVSLGCYGVLWVNVDRADAGRVGLSNWASNALVFSKKD